MSFTTKNYKKGKICLTKDAEQDVLRSAYKFLVRIVDNNDISSVPIIAAVTDAYYSNNKEKIVKYLKEVKELTNKFIDELEQK